VIPERKSQHMNTFTTIGLPAWQVNMIAWKRRSRKRFNRLISNAQRLSIRLFTSQRRLEGC
jgi:hypothetical protein